MLSRKRKKKKSPKPLRLTIQASKNSLLLSCSQSHDPSPSILSVSPIIVTFVNRVSSLIGALVILPCQAVGIEPITYIWTRARAEGPIRPAGDRHIAG